METPKKFFDILIIRHGESLFNKAQKDAVNSAIEVKPEFESKAVKFCADLLDCGLTDVGIK